MTADARPRLIPWLKEVPHHWAVRRAKYLFSQSRIAPSDDDGIVTAFRDGQVTLRENRRTDGFMLAEKEVGYQGVRRGQLVLHSMDAFAGAIGVSDSDGKCTPEYVVLQPRLQGIEPRFYAAVLREMARQRFIEVSCPSVRERAPRIRYSTFGDMLLPLPPAEEQHTIADLLDLRLESVGALIEKKERLVAATEELRVAIIADVVLGALSTAKRRDSRTPLGTIPEHWAAKRLMYLTAPGRPIMYGIVLPGPNVDDGVPIIKSGNCTRETLRPELLHKTTFEIEAGYERSRVAKNDIVYAIRGTVGMATLVPEDVAGANLTQDAARIAPGPNINPRWLLYAVQSASVWAQLAAGIVGATVKGINIRDLKRPFLPVPPRREQDEIAEYLDAEIGRLHDLEASTARSIERLREYRQALITAAVTGQLDLAAQEAA